MKTISTFQWLILIGFAGIELLFFPFIRDIALLPSFLLPIAFIYSITKKYHFVFLMLIAQFFLDYLFGNHFGIQTAFFCFFLFFSELILLHMKNFGFQHYWKKFGTLYFFIHASEFMFYGSRDFLSLSIESIETILLFPALYALLVPHPQKVDLHVQR